MWEDREVLIYSNYEPESSGTKNRRMLKKIHFQKIIIFGGIYVKFLGFNCFKERHSLSPFLSRQDRRIIPLDGYPATPGLNVIGT